VRLRDREHRQRWLRQAAIISAAASDHRAEHEWHDHAAIDHPFTIANLYDTVANARTGNVPTPASFGGTAVNVNP